MKTDLDYVAIGVFAFFFLLVTVMGFLAARWKQADVKSSIDEWAISGTAASGM